MQKTLEGLGPTGKALTESTKDKKFQVDILPCMNASLGQTLVNYN